MIVATNVTRFNPARFLRGHPKSKIYATQSDPRLDELNQRIVHKYRKVSPEMLRNVRNTLKNRRN